MKSVIQNHLLSEDYVIDKHYDKNNSLHSNGNHMKETPVILKNFNHFRRKKFKNRLRNF